MEMHKKKAPCASKSSPCKPSAPNHQPTLNRSINPKHPNNNQKPTNVNASFYGSLPIHHSQLIDN